MQTVEIESKAKETKKPLYCTKKTVMHFNFGAEEASLN